MNALARLFAVIVIFSLAACGGGMQAGVGSGGSGAPLSVGVGPVTGFGSVIVNGTRYDESSAEVLVDERPDRATPATVAAIRLGMHVELQHRNLVVSTAITSAELVGPVSSTVASGFVALGQTVRVNADPGRPTVFEGFEALADLVLGTIVEVHGDRTSTGEIFATRVELKPAGLPLVRIAGTASNVSGRSFSIANLSVDAAAATVVPAGATIANGQRVVAWTDVPYGGGTLAAKVVRVGSLNITPNAAVTLDGVIGDFQSSATFRVSGVLVNAGGSVTFTGGTAANLGNGLPVRVTGTSNGTVVNATSVEFLQAAQAAVQLTGPITDYVDAGRPFRIRNTLTQVTPQTTYTGGTASNLGTGVTVKITGLLTNGIVQASAVDFLPVTAGVQSTVSGQVAGPISASAADGSRTFRLDAVTSEVKTTSTTAYSNGAAQDVAVGRQIRVKGSLQGSQFVATEIQFLDNPASPPNVSISGVAGSVQATSVKVNGQQVQLTGSTTYTLNGAAATSASLRNGLAVEVVASSTTGTLTALSVEIKPPGTTATTIRGLVSDRTPANTEFRVGTQRVSVAGSPQVLPASRTLADIVNGADVEVEGTLSNGVLNATRIRLR